jgi:hypothetical protein
MRKDVGASTWRLSSRGSPALTRPALCSPDRRGRQVECRDLCPEDGRAGRPHRA